MKKIKSLSEFSEFLVVPAITKKFRKEKNCSKNCYKTKFLIN
jgi:hypothetical protein